MTAPASFHHAIVRVLMARLAGSPLIDPLAGLSDDNIIRRLFISYRSGHGLRLSSLGQKLMASCFENYEFIVDQKSVHHIPCVLFLDRHATMPYYWQGTKLVLYDMTLTMWLQLAGGDLYSLIELHL